MNEDEPNPNNFLETLGQKKHGVIYISDLFLDKYAVQDDTNTSIAFSASSENYSSPIFYGNIMQDYYQIRWKTYLGLNDTIEEIEAFIRALESIEIESERFIQKDDLFLSIENEDDGLILQIPLESLDSFFWQDPLTFLKNKQITRFSTLRIETNFCIISCNIDENKPDKMELCLESSTEQFKIMARLIDDTINVTFEQENAALSALEGLLGDYKETYEMLKSA